MGGFTEAEDFAKDLEKALAEAPQEEAKDQPKEDIAEEAPQEIEETTDEEEIVQTDNGKMIPYGRFKKINEKAKTAEQEAQRVREELIQVKTRLEMMERQGKPEVKAEPVQELSNVDPIDPEAHRYYEAKIEKQAKELEKATALSQQALQAIQFESMRNKIIADRASFIQEKPDYDNAYKHLYDLKVKEAKRSGMDGKNAEGWAQQYIGQVAVRAAITGIDAAAEVYGMAQDFGYTPKKEAGNNHEKREQAIKKTETIRAPSAGGGIGNASNPVAAMRTKSGRVDPVQFMADINRITKSS